MKIKAIKVFYTTETGAKKIGEVFEVPENAAKGLAKGGYVVIVDEPAAEKPTVEKPAAVTRKTKSTKA